MADFDPKTATLREVAEAYAKKSKRKDFVSPTIQYFKDIADEPGSALRLFEKDAEGFTLLSKTFGNTGENAPVKAAMQNIRQVGLLLKENLGPDTAEYKLLPDKAPNTDLNNRIFGRIEPSKAEAQIAINPDPKVQSQFFSGVAKYLDDPATRPAALAIIFNLNTGLRPNAVLNLSMKEYMPDTGAVYIETDVAGTKGRPVNIPLNPIADSILQELLVDIKPGDFFFRKPGGAQVKTTDINKILRAVKVPNLMYDQATKTYYDSLHPEKGPGKTGSPLLRNVHSIIALDIGIPQERTAYLQGRSLKAASKGSTGELAGYQKAFPGNVGDLDRDFASQISSFWGQSATDAGFDVQSKIPMPETRITTKTVGYEGYFELPVREEVPTTLKSTDNIDKNVASSNLQEELSSKGLDWDGLVKNIGKTLDTIQKIPGAKSVLPIAAATSGYIAGKSEAADLGLPAVAQEVVGAFSGASELTPFSMTDIADTASGFSVAATEEQKRIDELRNRAISQRDSGMIPEPDRVPQAAPAQDQGFLSR